MPAWLCYPSWTRYNLLWLRPVLNLFLNNGLRMRLSMSLLDYTNSIPCPWGEGLLHLGPGASPPQGHHSLLHKTQHSYPRSGEIQWFNISWWWTTLYQEHMKLVTTLSVCPKHSTLVTLTFSRKHGKCRVLIPESEWYTHAALSM